MLMTRLMDRPDRKTMARLLSAKGLSTRQIAKVLGFSHMSIARDLAVSNETPDSQKAKQSQGHGVTNVTVAP
jgi:IS30 family transposase